MGNGVHLEGSRSRTAHRGFIIVVGLRTRIPARSIVVGNDEATNFSFLSLALFALLLFWLSVGSEILFCEVIGEGHDA